MSCILLLEIHDDAPFSTFLLPSNSLVISAQSFSQLVYLESMPISGYFLYPMEKHSLRTRACATQLLFLSPSRTTNVPHLKILPWDRWLLFLYVDSGNLERKCIPMKNYRTRSWNYKHFQLPRHLDYAGRIWHIFCIAVHKVEFSFENVINIYWILCVYG